MQWQKRAEGRIEIAKNLIAMKLESIEQIAQASGLSVEEVSNLRGKTEQAQNAKESFHAMWRESIFLECEREFSESLAAHAKTKTLEPRGVGCASKTGCATLFAAMRQFQKFHKVLCAHDNVVVWEMFQISGYEFCVAKLGDFVKFFVGFICKLQF